MAVLPEGTLYAVGGRVRDEVRTELDGRNRDAKDLDYVVTGVGLDDLIARLGRAGRTNVVGATFAVIKVVLGDTVVDVALPRRERSTGAGHRDFEIDAGPDIPLADDLSRRDFRMNMLARALPSRRLVDPYAGAADIAARRIDILTDDTFVQDPLRMLRAAQFAARFEFTLTDRTFSAMREAAPLVTTLSAERIRDELSKLLTARRPSQGFEVLRSSGILALILPELAEGVGIEQNQFHAYDVYRHNLATVDAVSAGDLVARLAALFHDVGKPRTKDGPHFYRHEYVGAQMVSEALTRLRFPLDTVQLTSHLVANHMYATGPEQTDYAIRKFIRRVGPDNLARQFSLRHADIAGSGLPKRSDENERFEARVATVLSAAPPLGVTNLAIGGDDVIELAVRAGLLPAGSRGAPLVGTILRRLLEVVTENPAENTRERLLERVTQLLSNAGDETD